jgi:hypothetical protein
VSKEWSDVPYDDPVTRHSADAASRAAQRRVHPAHPLAGDVLTFDQLAEHVIWADLQPPAVDVHTITVRCSSARNWKPR